MHVEDNTQNTSPVSQAEAEQKQDASAPLSEELGMPEKVGMPEKLGMKDAYAGYRIKDVGDKAGFIGVIGSLVVGFMIWSRINDFSGFLIGFLVVGLGIFASYVLTSVLHSYGDMLTNSFEQTKILKRLEDQKISDLLKREQEEAKQKQAAEAAEAAAAEQADKEAQEEKSAEADEQPKEELNTPEAKRRALEKKLRLPLRGVVDARMRRVAHFAERSRYGVLCPICGRKQDSARNNCYFCDCKFVYDDEPFQTGNDDTLDHLRRLITH
jgi:ribosomal protein L12E/L44/L45/RPP1/RPP2